MRGAEDEAYIPVIVRMAFRAGFVVGVVFGAVGVSVAYILMHK